MALGEPVARRLIVNADDFGRSRSINEAVIRAHREGILTSASLMVNGEAFEEAVELARANPFLGVGLHLTFVCGSATLPREKIPGLVNSRAGFSEDPVRAGVSYFFRKNLRPQLEAEMDAQFEKFKGTGLKLDHVNGHLHFHLHPTIFGLLRRRFKAWGLEAVRLTRDPFLLNARIARGRWLYRSSHGLIFGLLASRSGRLLAQDGIKRADRVFGLLQNGRVDEAYVTALIRCLPEGVSELYSHPSLCEFRPEFEALINSGVKDSISWRGIKLIRYQDL